MNQMQSNEWSLSTERRKGRFVPIATIFAHHIVWQRLNRNIIREWNIHADVQIVQMYVACVCACCERVCTGIKMMRIYEYGRVRKEIATGECEWDEATKLSSCFLSRVIY